MRTECDPKIIELAWNIPARHKYGNLRDNGRDKSFRLFLYLPKGALRGIKQWAIIDYYPG